MNETREASGRALAVGTSAALAAGAASGVLWGALAVLTGRELGIAVIAVACAAAWAARRASGVGGGARLWAAAAGGSVLGLLLAKFVFVARAMVELTEAAPDRPPGFHLSMFDPRILRLFARVLPRVLTSGGALWLALALGAAWLVLNPPRRI